MAAAPVDRRTRRPDGLFIVLTRQEAADLAGMSLAGLDKWRLQDPTFPANRIGRLVRIPTAPFLDWLAGHHQEQSS